MGKKYDKGRSRGLILHFLHCMDIWTQELTEHDFRFIYTRSLSRKERLVTDLMIECVPINEIARLFNNKASSIERILYKIKRKYRLGCETRVDNWKTLIKGRKK